MKSSNMFTVQLLQYVRFIYKVKNATLIKKLSNIVKNAQNKKFVMHFIFKKKGVQCFIKIYYT